MTKCTFHKFGSSGEIEKHDAMCILPLNIGIQIELDVGDDYFYSNFTILLSLQPDVVLTFDILSMNTARSNSKKFKYQN